jgi:lipoate---protein ligase
LTEKKTVNKLLCLNNKSIDPFFNLALEEYLLKNYGEDIFMLWQNEPSIVVGKHQNTLAEINSGFIKENNIKVLRRLSGGGTVYHDEGNLNFTYIMNGIEGKLVNFIKYTNDILEVLNNLGVPAERSHRNDLVIDGKKISGNAEHIFKNRLIHHGTLLFNSDLERLNEAIRIEEGKFEDKSVQSVRSTVANISSYLNSKISIEQFKNALMNFVLLKYPQAELYELKLDEFEFINKLKDEKYYTWDWIYGYSPKFKVKKQYAFSNGDLQLELFVKKGQVEEIQLKGKLFTNDEMICLKKILIGSKYEKEQFRLAFAQNPFIQSHTKFSDEDIVNLFF